ncbi:LLM class flavin-dependent oxidoreductase [Jatrophihabitans sp. YIM 134969]
MTHTRAGDDVRPWRFGVVAPVLTDLPTWRDHARRIADLGFSTLLLPDVPHWQPAPAPALAVAAAVTDLRVGTWVYAAPFRLPWQLAWEAHSMSVVTEDRFELGIGTGRPGLGEELRALGMPPSPDDRAAQIRAALTALRELDGSDRHTPVAMAVRGPKALEVAAEFADTVNIAQRADHSRAEVVQLAREFRERRDVELALHVSVVGDTVAPFMAGPGTDTAALHAADSLLVLPSDPDAAVEELLRRREEAGFSYVVVGANAMEQVAPVVARLAG